MRRALAAAAAALSLSFAGAVGAQDTDESVLETVDAFFIALAAGDADALEALVTPEGVTVRLTPETEAAPRYGRLADIVAAFREGKGTPVVEPYWSPTVLRRGPLAVVWAPYEVSVDGALIHCGIDTFLLSSHDGDWKIDAVSYTAEPSACDELRPEDRSVMRPDFPQGE